jgi:hypothetical protein
LPILGPRSPETVVLAALGILLLWSLARAWRGMARTRVLAACFPAVRENAARHLLPLAEAALRARRLLEQAHDPLEPGAAALEPGCAELLRLVRGFRELPAGCGGGGVLWLTSARAEVAVTRLWAVLAARLDERLGADDLALAAAGDDAGLERLRPRLRRWLRGDPGPDAELWLLDALGRVLGAEIRGLDRLGDGKRGVPRRELRVLRQRLGPMPSGLPDGQALAEALGEWLGSKDIKDEKAGKDKENPESRDSS